MRYLLILLFTMSFNICYSQMYVIKMKGSPAVKVYINHINNKKGMKSEIGDNSLTITDTSTNIKRIVYHWEIEQIFAVDIVPFSQSEKLKNKVVKVKELPNAVELKVIGDYFIFPSNQDDLSNCQLTSKIDEFTKAKSTITIPYTIAQNPDTLKIVFRRVDEKNDATPKTQYYMDIIYITKIPNKLRIEKGNVLRFKFKDSTIDIYASSEFLGAGINDDTDKSKKISSSYNISKEAINKISTTKIDTVIIRLADLTYITCVVQKEYENRLSIAAKCVLQ